MKKKRKIDGFRKKLMISQSQISARQEFKVKSKIGNIFLNEKILEEYSVNVYEIDPYFYEHHQEKIQTRSDMFFTPMRSCASLILVHISLLFCTLKK